MILRYSARPFLLIALLLPGVATAEVVKGPPAKGEDWGWAFLKDMEFRFKIFESQRTPGETSLGFSYAYDQDKAYVISTGTAENGNTEISVAVGLAAEGNVAFEQSVNPNDFLDTKLKVSLKRSAGGLFDLPSDSAERLAKIAQEQSQLEPDDDRYQELEREAAKLFRAGATEAHSNVSVLDLNAKAGLESNQDFSQKQWAYGLHLGWAGRGEQNADAARFSETSTLARWNILDYPFALLRIFTGYDKGFVPKAQHSLPSVSLGISQVDPTDDSARKALGEEDLYPRWEGEISFKTPFARTSQGEIFFSINYRVYNELTPSETIESAGLDSFEYTAVTIGGASGVYVAYTAGRLPLDVQKDKVYELGYTFNF